MFKVAFFIAVLFCKIMSKLIVPLDQEDNIGVEDLKNDADLIDSKIIPDPGCAGAELLHEKYKYYLQHSDGSLTEQTFTLEGQVSHQTRIYNTDEPWIVGDLIIKCNKHFLIKY